MLIMTGLKTEAHLSGPVRRRRGPSIHFACSPRLEATTTRAMVGRHGRVPA